MVDSINALGYTQNSKLIRLDGGVTKRNNEFGIFKDSQGNSVYRVDYQNNNPENIFDEEEVRNSDGNLISYTERSYSKDGKKMYFKKHIFDENGKETQVLETECDNSGKPIKTKKLPPEHGLRGHVTMGVPVDGVDGDPELREKLTQYGTDMIGRQ